MNRHPAHILLLKAARALELLIAAVILLVIVCGAVFFVPGRLAGPCSSPQRPSPWGISSPPHCCW